MGHCYLIVCSVLSAGIPYLNPFQSSVAFLYPLKTSENLRFSDVSRGYRKATSGCNGLNKNNAHFWLLFQSYEITKWLFPLCWRMREIAMSKLSLLSRSTIYDCWLGKKKVKYRSNCTLYLSMKNYHSKYK